MNDMEYEAALDALNTIKKQLTKHWMRKPGERSEPDGDEMMQDEPAASLEISVEAEEEPTEMIDESPVARETEPEAMRVVEYGFGSTRKPPAPPPQETMKRKRGRPPKAR